MTHVSSGSESVPKITLFVILHVGLLGHKQLSRLFQRTRTRTTDTETRMLDFLQLNLAALNILFYLPVNSLSWWRSVCKSWNEFCSARKRLLISHTQRRCWMNLGLRIHRGFKKEDAKTWFLRFVYVCILSTMKILIRCFRVRSA